MLQNFAPKLAHKAFSDFLEGRTTLSSVNKFLKGIASLPEGKTMIQSALKDKALPSIDDRQAKRNMSMKMRHRWQ